MDRRRAGACRPPLSELLCFRSPPHATGLTPRLWPPLRGRCWVLDGPVSLLGQTSGIVLLLLLVACKLLATSVGLDLGSLGGIFSPSPFMGATLGAGFARPLGLLELPIPIDSETFALVAWGRSTAGRDCLAQSEHTGRYFRQYGQNDAERPFCTWIKSNAYH